MRRAIINTSFSVVQSHGTDYAYYESDAEACTYEVGDEVIVLHEAQYNPMGKLFVIFNERINSSVVVIESYLFFR